jgi:hypothetical protein
MSTNAGPEVIEGIWEDIAARAHEFAGKRIRITLLPDLVLEQKTARVSSVNLVPAQRISADSNGRDGSRFSIYD